MSNGLYGFSNEEAMRMLQSPAGQQLIRMLQATNDPSLQIAMEQANKGNMDGAKNALEKICADKEIQKLLSQLGGRHG